MCDGFNKVDTKNKMFDYIMLKGSPGKIHTCLGTPILAGLKKCSISIYFSV